MSAYVCVPSVPEKDIRSPETGVTESCELPCGCWESNPGPLKEQAVFLTAEPSLQSQKQMFIHNNQIHSDK